MKKQKKNLIFLLLALLAMSVAMLTQVKNAKTVAGTSKAEEEIAPDAVVAAVVQDGGQNAAVVESDSAESEFASIEILSSTPQETVLKFKLGDYAVKKAEGAGAEKYHQISAAGLNNEEQALKLAKEGGPALPVYSINVAVADNAKYTVLISDTKHTRIEQVRPMPSAGLAWKHNGECAVPSEDPAIYSGNQKYPVSNVEIGDEFKIRDLAYDQIKITPMQYDPETGSLDICTEAIITITTEEDVADTILAYDENREFATIQQDLAYNSAAIRSGITPDISPNGSSIGTLLIVAPKSWMPYLSSFITWKNRLGYTTITARYPDDTGEGAEAVQAYVADAYTNRHITHLLIVGDSDDVPTFFTDDFKAFTSATWPLTTDGPYSMLSGDDAYPDIFAARLSVDDGPQAQKVQKDLISWESGLKADDAIMQVGTFIASNSYTEVSYFGSKKDYENMDDMFGVLADAGLFSNATSTKLYTGINGFTDTSTSMALNALNGGNSLVCYIGHGYESQLYTSRFASAHAKNLINRHAMPFMFLGACLVGDFAWDGGDCLAESFFRNPNNDCGAAAVIAASGNTYWDPPIFQLKKLAEIRAAAADISANRQTSIGGYYLSSLNAALNFCNTVSDGPKLHIGPAKYYADETHLFGDPTQISRMANFIDADVDCIIEDSVVIVTVTDAATHRPVRNAVVCLDNCNGTYNGAFTDENGQAALALGTGNDATFAIRVISPEIRLWERKYNVREGDFNGDGAVDIDDILYFTTYYSSEISPESEDYALYQEWAANCDLNKDAVVDIDDVLLLVYYYNCTDNSAEIRGQSNVWCVNNEDGISTGLHELPIDANMAVVAIALPEGITCIQATADNAEIIGQNMDEDGMLKFLLSCNGEGLPSITIVFDGANTGNFKIIWAICK